MKYASFSDRFIALLIDGALIFFIGLIFPPIVFLTMLLYYPVFESSRMRATPGKYLMKTVLLNEDGSTLSYKQAFLRQLVGS